MFLPSLLILAVIGTSDTLAPTADAYLRGDSPNQNRGSQDTLSLRSFSGNTKVHAIVVSFDQASIAARIGSDRLDSARIEFRVKRVAGWPTAGDQIKLYPILNSAAPTGWTETGATWNCPKDVMPANTTLECPGGQWSPASMGSGTPSATLTVKNSTTGWVKFNVTADVNAYLGGQANRGWYLTKLTTNNNQIAVFWARESTSKPRLVLWVTRSNVVPALPPDSLPAWFRDDTSYASNDHLRNVITVLFRENATQPQRQDAIDLVGGKVIGGVRLSSGDGTYYVFVPAANTEAQLDSAVSTLKRLPQVEAAVLVDRGAEPLYLRPTDGVNRQ